LGSTPTSGPKGGVVVGWCVLVEAELAGFLGQLIQSGSTLRAPALLEVDEVLEADPAMAVRLLKGDGTVFEELDQGGPAHPEEVSRLLGGEEQPLGGDEGGLALTHDFDHLAQDAVDLGGERDLLAIGAEQ
jgi:hypothetical protein